MPISTIAPSALAQKLAGPGSRPVLLDVRLPEEHALVALPGSLLIPLHELGERIDELDDHRDAELVVYCHHGVRSLDATAFLESRGFRAASLSGGIDRYALQVDPRLPRY